MAGDSDIQGNGDPRAHDAKGGAPKKPKLPDAGKTTNADPAGVTPAVPGKRTNTDGMPADATAGVGKSTQVDAKEGKEEGKGGGGGGGGGADGKETNHTLVDEKAAKGKDAGGNKKGKDAAGDKDKKVAGKNAGTGKDEGKDAAAPDGKNKDAGNTFYTAKPVMPADTVDIGPMPTFSPLVADAPKSNKNLDDKWKQETGRTPAEHHTQIQAELQKLDAEIQRVSTELQGAVDRHVTKVTSDITNQVGSFKSTLIAPGRARVEAAYSGLTKGFEDAEKQALDNIKKHKATGLAQIKQAKTRNQQTLDAKFKNAKGLTTSMIARHVPAGAQAIKQFATGIPAWIKEAKNLSNEKAAEAGASYKPESFMNATDLAGGLKALTEEVKKQHVLNHGRKLGAQYEATLMGWSRNADKKAEETVKNALLSSQIELEGALDVATNSSKKAMTDADTAVSSQLETQEKGANAAVTAARTNGIKKFETEKTGALTAADQAGNEFTDNTTNAGTELTERIKKKAADDAKSYQVVVADLQRQLKTGKPQKFEQVQPKIEGAKQSLLKSHTENISGLDKLVTEGTGQLTQTVTKQKQIYSQAITDREGGAKKLQAEVLANIGKGATEMGGSLANIGKVFDDTTTRESAKVDFAIAEFQKGADAALKDFGAKVKQQLEQERTALYENLKTSANPDTMKQQSEGDAAAEVVAKQKSIDKDVTAMRAAMDGWGTDEGKIFGILRKLGHGEITYLHAAYNDHYKHRAKNGKTALVYDFHDEMSGNDLKIAMAYLNHNREAAIKLELADSIGFFNDDEARIEDILRNCDQKEIEHLNTNPEAKAIVIEVKNSLGGADLDVMNTLLDKDVDKADRENKANAIRLYDAMDGWGTDEAKMKSILEGAKTPEERLKLRAAFNQYAASKGEKNADGGDKGEQDDALTRMIKDDTSGGEQAVMLTLAKTDQTKSELAAAKMYQGADGMGTDEDQIFEALDDEAYAAAWKQETDPAKRKVMEEARKAQLDKDLRQVSNGELKSVDGMLEEEMTKGQLIWEEIESGTKKDGTKVSANEKNNAKKYLEWMVAKRKLQTGQAEPELMIAYACFGLGTNEEVLQKALSRGGEPLSIAETDRINKSFARIWGQNLVNRHELLQMKWANAEKTETGPAPGGLLSDELSGKDWNKTRQLMCGKPETAEQLKYLSTLRKEYATSGLIGGALMTVGEAVGYTDSKSDAEAQQQRFDKLYADKFKANPTAKLADTPEGQELERLGEYLAADYEAYSAALSALVDGIVTAIEIIGAIVITVLTAGTAGPVLMAVLYNLALSATTIVFKAAALGDQYGAAELGADVVKAAGSAAFAGVGELKVVGKLADRAGNAGAKGVASLAKLGDDAMTKAGVKLGEKGLLEMTPQSVDKLAKIVSAGTKSVMLSSGQEVYSTLTDEKTYSMKLEDVIWGENSLGKKLLMGAPKAFASGAVTQWINGISGVSNRDNVGRLKKPFPNALGNALAEMGGATAGFFAYLDNYQDAEKFWKGLLQANAQAGISGFAQGWAMHKTRAKRSGRDFLNGELTPEGLLELHKALDPNEVADLAQFVEKYGGKDAAAKLPAEFRSHTSQDGSTTKPANENQPQNEGTESAADGTQTAKADDEKKNPTGDKEDDTELKAKEADEAKRKKDEADQAEAKRKQDEADALQKKQQQDQEEAERKQRDADEAKRKQDEAEAAARKKEQDAEAQRAEEQRLKKLADEETARKKTEAEAAAKKQREEQEAARKRQEDEAAARKKQAEEDEAYRRKAEDDAKLKKQQEDEAHLAKQRADAELKKKQEDELWARKADEDAKKRAELDQRARDDVSDDNNWLSEDAPLGDEQAARARDKKRKRDQEDKRHLGDDREEDLKDPTDPERKDKKQQRADDKDDRLDDQHTGELAAKNRRRQAELLELATQAHAEYAGKIEDAKAMLKELVGDLGEVQGRAKDPESAANRLKRAEDQFGAQITDVASAKDNLWDALGTRLVVSGKPEEIASVMKKLADAVAAGKLKIIQTNSNHGDGVAPYMSQADIDRLAAASGGTMEGGAGEVKKAPADKSAFTSGLIFVQYPDGTRGEIQIIGKKVLEVAAIEHIPYDISIGKPLARGLDEKYLPAMKEATAGVEAAIRALDKDPVKKAEYDQYLRDLYKHARDSEMGIESPPPKLPAGIDKSLSAEGLRAVYDQIEGIKAKAKAETDSDGPQQKPKGDQADDKKLADDDSAKKDGDQGDAKTWADDQRQTEKPDLESPEQAKQRRSAGLKPTLADADETKWAQPEDRKGVPEGVPLSRQELRDAITKRYGRFVEKYQKNVSGDGLENHPDFKPLLDEMRALKPGSITREQGDQYLKRWTEISDRIAKSRGEHGAELRVLYNVVEQDDFPAWFQHVNNLPKEQQAKLGHMWREEWKIYVRDMMSDESSKEILYLRDLALSGDRRGGNFQDFYNKRLAEKGDSDAALDSIAASSMRSNPKVNAWLTGAGDGISDLATSIRTGRENDDGNEQAAKPKVGGNEGGEEQKDKKQAARTVDESKLNRLDELAKLLQSDDQAVRTKAQADLDQLKADPEWKDALKLKDDLFGTLQSNQKADGSDVKMLSDNIPTLLDEADRQRLGKNPELQAKRDKFERALALAVLKEGPIRAEIDAELARLCEKAFDYISKTRSGDEMGKAVGGLGIDASKGFGGAVGKDQNVMLDVLANGNIRERMIALSNFMELLGKDALSEQGRAKLQQLAAGDEGKDNPHANRQYTAEDAKRVVERVLAYQENTEAKDQSARGLFRPTAEETQAGGKHEDFGLASTQKMDTKLPPLVAEKVAEFLGKQVAADQSGVVPGAEASPLARSQITVKEAIEKGLQLSDREIEAAGGLDAPLNWVVGQRANIVDPKAKFIADAKENSLPLKAGISGTTYRWMQVVELLGGDPKLARLAAVASLQAIDAHSFHEIAMAAKGFGAAYDPSQPYAHIGLDAEQLKALADSVGTTLDELNGKTQDDKTGT